MIFMLIDDSAVPEDGICTNNTQPDFGDSSLMTVNPLPKDADFHS